MADSKHSITASTRRQAICKDGGISQAYLCWLSARAALDALPITFTSSEEQAAAEAPHWAEADAAEREIFETAALTPIGAAIKLTQSIHFRWVAGWGSGQTRLPHRGT